MKKKTTYWVELTYHDDSTTGFEVSTDEPFYSFLGTLNMILRGTLMASIAERITAYNKDGFDVCSYQK